MLSRWAAIWLASGGHRFFMLLLAAATTVGALNCGNCVYSRRSALVGAAALSGTAAAAQARTPPAAVVTDRNGAAVTEASWLSKDRARADLVLGLDGEPYFLIIDETPVAPDAEPDAEPSRRLLDYALKAECTHLGCLVQQDVSSAIGPLAFACPCHGSRYDALGSVTRGPAPAALGLAKVEAREADGVLVMSAWAGTDPRKAAAASG